MAINKHVFWVLLKPQNFTGFFKYHIYVSKGSATYFFKDIELKESLEKNG